LKETGLVRTRYTSFVGEGKGGKEGKGKGIDTKRRTLTCGKNQGWKNGQLLTKGRGVMC